MQYPLLNSYWAVWVLSRTASGPLGVAVALPCGAPLHKGNFTCATPPPSRENSECDTPIFKSEARHLCDTLNLAGTEYDRVTLHLSVQHKFLWADRQGKGEGKVDKQQARAG